MTPLRIFLNIVLSLFGFSGFIYLTLLSVYKMYFDYDRNMLRTSAAFIASTWLALYLSGTEIIFDHQSLWWAMSILILCTILMCVFSFLWQTHGRPYMPKLPIRSQITTLYDFTPRFCVAKFFEISFQNILAYILVVSVHVLTDDITTTITLFGVTFFITHLLTVSFFGKWWGIFMAIMAPVGAIVVVVGYLLVPNGILYVIGFHILMYVAFLMVLRRLALRK
jgi:hypothetical protein